MILTIMYVLQNQGLLDCNVPYPHHNVILTTCLHEVFYLHTILENREGND